jgi:hypothetical protein
VIDTDSLEWKLRKLREAVDMLRHECENNRLYGIRHGGVPKPALGRLSNWPWQN